MNYNKIVQSFTEAVAKTKGTPLPTEPILMCEQSRRFLFDMIMSEMGEYHLARCEEDEVDAVVDAAIYLTDTCLRFGIEPYLRKTGSTLGTPTQEVYEYALLFLTCRTIDTQHQALSMILTRLERSFNYSLEPFMVAVAETNQQKIHADGTVTMNEQGKVLKPEGFKHGNLTAVLKEVKNGEEKR